MKILINAITAKMGGFKTLINSFIQNIDENDGYEYVFLIYKGSISTKIDKKNIKIEETLIGDIGHIKRFFWYQFVLTKYIRENKFDYMINLTNYGPINPCCKQILLLHNPKHVSNEIKKNSNTVNKLKLLLENFVFRLSLLGVEKLIVQTDYMKQGVIKYFKFSENKIEVIPSAPSELSIGTTDNRLEHSINRFIGTNNNVLANITLYAKHKNLDTLLKAIRYIKDHKLCDCKLIMTIGEAEGEEAKNLLSLINEYSISDYVLSVGNIKHENIHLILSKAKVFVFPSYAESFGIPFVEAMRFSLPIIAADLGFAYDVCGECALYFKYDDYKNLAEQIVEIFKNKELREQMVVESCNRSTLYDEKKIINAYLNLLR